MTLTLLILSHGRLNFVLRSLEYYSKWFSSGRVVLAWSGGEPDLVKMNKAAAGLDFRVEVYPSTIPFHHKIRDALGTIDNEFVFLIGDDDLANVSIANHAMEQLTNLNADFCAGPRIEVDAINHIVRPYWSEVFHQSTLEMRLAFKLIKNSYGNKGFVSNWHIYGVHRRTALLKALEVIGEFSGYSGAVEDLFLILLSAKSPWLRLKFPIAIHDGENIKEKDKEDGGYPVWKDQSAVDRCREIRVEFLSSLITNEAVQAHEHALVDGLGDIHESTWYNPEVYRCHIHKLLAKPAIEAKKASHIARIRKVSVVLRILAHLLASRSLVIQILKRLRSGELENLIHAIAVLGKRQEIADYLSGKMLSPLPIADAINTLSNSTDEPVIQN